MEPVIVPYEVEHAKRIVEKKRRPEEDFARDWKVAERFATTVKDTGPAYTLMLDGDPIACGGITLQGWNRGEAWALFSTDVYQHVLSVYRGVKYGLAAIMDENRLIRVQTLVDPRFPVASRFVERLGFEREGLLKKYGPGGMDFFMYAVTR